MNRGYNTVVFDIETKLVNREQVPILAGVLTETTFQLISTKHCVFDLVEEFL